jgi:hypothetical protein
MLKKKKLNKSKTLKKKKEPKLFSKSFKIVHNRNLKIVQKTKICPKGPLANMRITTR